MTKPLSRALAIFRSSFGRVFFWTFLLILVLIEGGEFLSHLRSCGYGPGSSSSKISVTGTHYEYPKAQTETVRQLCGSVPELVQQFQVPLVSTLGTLGFFLAGYLLLGWLKREWGSIRSDSNSSLGVCLLFLLGHALKSVFRLAFAGFFTIFFTAAAFKTTDVIVVGLDESFGRGIVSFTVLIISVYIATGFCLGLAIAEGLCACCVHKFKEGMEKAIAEAEQKAEMKYENFGQTEKKEGGILNV